MPKKLSPLIAIKLNRLLANVGDMALKRRVKEVVAGLDIKGEENLADIGTGNGYYLYVLRKLYPQLRLVGIDNDKRALKAARLVISDPKFIVSDISLHINCPNNTFDKIIVSEVVEHLTDPDRALIEICRVLKPGGKLVLTTPNRNYPFFWDPVNWILEKFFKTHVQSGFWAGIWNQHQRLFSVHEMEDLLKRGGFATEKLQTLTFWCLPFNHYFVNFWARLLYGHKLSPVVANSINKFKQSPQPLWIRLVFKFLNTFDSLNDYFQPGEGVSILALASKK